MSSKSQHICLVAWNQRTNNNFNLVKNCQPCNEHRHQHPEPLMPTPLPERPWQMIGSDLFTLKNTNYLLVVDYYSRYVEVITLRGSTSSKSVIAALKTMFARHGIPDELRSDNGPQFHSDEFAQFASDSFTPQAALATLNQMDKWSEL